MSKRKQVPNNFSKKVIFGNPPRKLKKKIWGTRDRPNDKRTMLITMLCNQAEYMKKCNWRGSPNLTPEGLLRNLGKRFSTFLSIGEER